MKKEPLNKEFAIEVNRSANVSLNSFNLLSLVEKMKHKPTLFKGDLHSMVLLNRPDKQIVLTTFDKGTEINSFQSKELMILQVIWGKLKLHTRDKSLKIRRGELFTLHEKKPYILTTRERTVFLLTLISGSIGQSKINITDNEKL
jgi:quercetin dioxygenase-like cupin family protein